MKAKFIRQKLNKLLNHKTLFGPILGSHIKKNYVEKLWLTQLQHFYLQAHMLLFIFYQI